MKRQMAGQKDSIWSFMYQTSSEDVKWATGFTNLEYREWVRTKNVNVVNYSYIDII